MSAEHVKDGNGNMESREHVADEIDGKLSPRSRQATLVDDPDLPPSSKRPKLASAHNNEFDRRTKSTNDAYITPANTSETMSSMSSGSSSNSVSSGSGQSMEQKQGPSEESDEVSTDNRPQQPTREFLRQELPRPNHARHHQAHYPTPVAYPAAGVPADYLVPSQAMLPSPVRNVTIEQSQMPFATVTVPIPGAPIPAMPHLHPAIHPPILPAAQVRGEIGSPMAPALNLNGQSPQNLQGNLNLPSPQQIVTAYDPAFTLAFHYHFYPPGVSFYPVGIPTGIPGIVFPGTLNHGLSQTPQTSLGITDPKIQPTTAPGFGTNDPTMAVPASGASIFGLVPRVCFVSDNQRAQP